MYSSMIWKSFAVMNFSSKDSGQGPGSDDVFHAQNSNSMDRHKIEAHLNPSNPKDDNNFTVLEDSDAMELYSRVRSQKEEIQTLREQIATASLRELQLRNEKYALERKLADLRLAVDERQNEAVTSTLNELVRRKGDLEENLKLTHELEVVERERYVFVSSMLRLLAEYGIWPHVVNASALSYSIKHLHDELQWKIRTSNDKIREVASAVGTQAESESYPDKKTRTGILKSQIPHDSTDQRISSSNHYVQEQNMGPSYNVPRYKNDVNLVGKTSLVPDGRIHQQLHNQNSEDFSFNPDRQGLERTKEFFDPSGTYDKMASSSFDEGPGIDDFQIIGNATPGEKLLGCGYPVRGTSLCMFQWVRHLKDGTRQYIEGATNPEYVVTADDVDKLIAVECIPMDDLGHQGELVKIFANDQNKIKCDPDMQQEIDMYISKGEAAFSVMLLTDTSDNWEPTTLLLQRSGFQIKSNSKETIVIAEKFSKDLSIKILSGLSTQVVLACSDRSSHPLSAPNVRMRDILVLTMRRFQSKALDEKRKNRV